MSWTKRELISEAFSELGLQGYEFDITPEEQLTALRRLESMMATFEAKGVRVGYAFQMLDTSDPDTDSGLPDSAIEPVYLNLAIRLGPGFGKAIRFETKQAAKDGYTTLLWLAAQPQQQQFRSGMPAGAGNRSRIPCRPFLAPPDRSPLVVGPGGDLNILPE
jgi:hypothetical protein